MKTLLYAGSLLALIAAVPAWAATAGADKQFTEQASAAGMAEVAAGKLAETRAADPAVRVFARWMVTDHTAMNEMLARHAKGDEAAALTPEQQASISALEKLDGTAFDQHYLQDQVEAHTNALNLFNREAESGQDEQLKSMAHRAVPMLEQHLAAATELRHSRDSNLAHSATSATPGPAATATTQSATPGKADSNPEAAKQAAKEGEEQLKVEGK
jgi:putative membrane protein